MLSRWAKTMIAGSLLGALCLPVQANTTDAGNVAAAVVTHSVDVGGPILQRSLDEPVVSTAPALAADIRIALLLPSHSDTLREAARAVRAGFEAAYAREQDGVAITIVETGDAPEDVLEGYQMAAGQADIVVGPLTRSGVAAVAQNGSVDRPTLALAAPDAGSKVKLPPQMLVMGLSIEDEARQAAEWARKEHPQARALIFHTGTAWQRRAARAFETQWLQYGLQAEAIELNTDEGYLIGREVLQLKKQLQPDLPEVMFAALDARQARQLRALMGKNISLYGTSQLNPLTLAGRAQVTPLADMDGARLFDIPWQLQEDHPAVMSYARSPENDELPRSADLERLYALGIDAYRVARGIAANRNRFELDGVTGRLTVSFGKTSARFVRTIQRAVYRGGSVVSLRNP